MKGNFKPRLEKDGQPKSFQEGIQDKQKMEWILMIFDDFVVVHWQLLRRSDAGKDQRISDFDIAEDLHQYLWVVFCYINILLDSGVSPLF